MCHKINLVFISNQKVLFYGPKKQLSVTKNGKHQCVMLKFPIFHCMKNVVICQTKWWSFFPEIGIHRPFWISSFAIQSQMAILSLRYKCSVTDLFIVGRWNVYKFFCSVQNKFYLMTQKLWGPEYSLRVWNLNAQWETNQPSVMYLFCVRESSFHQVTNQWINNWISPFQIWLEWCQ